MPSRLHAPVLTLDVGKMHEIDPRNVESLFGMWTVFNKCSKSIKDGSRLENMSWRIWARETLCCPPQPERAIVPDLDALDGHHSEPPSLSNSVASSDSGSDDDEPTTDQSPKRRPFSHDDEDSALSKSRGNETHLTPTALEKIVFTIREKTELGPLSPSIEASLPPLQSPDATPLSKPRAEQEEEHASKEMHNSTDSCASGATMSTVVTNTTRASDHRDSDTSVSSDGLIRSGSVVHGFSPVSTSFRAKAMQALPVPASKLAPASAKKPIMFQLGASSEDDESSFEAKIQSFRPQQRSSLSQSLSRHQLTKGLEKKKASFRDIVEQRKAQSDAQNDEGAIESSDEEDESAIDDEDEEEDGDWEDSPSDDEKPAPPQKPTFERVDRRPGLVSRPSMLSMALNQKPRTSALQNEASRSSPAFRRSRTSSPQGPSMPGSPEEHDDDGGLMMQGAKSRPRPIVMNTSNPQQSIANSPRTTRRNMLSTELTESLRKNLLWERQQKSQTVNAFMKRSRNAQSMANLPAAGQAASREQRSNSSWAQEFENPWEFHSKGW